jgi:hypothetical protein
MLPASCILAQAALASCMPVPMVSREVDSYASAGLSKLLELAAEVRI